MIVGNSVGCGMCAKVARAANDRACKTELGGTYVTIEDVLEAYRAQGPTDEQRVAMLSYLRSVGVLDCRALDPVICEGIFKIS